MTAGRDTQDDIFIHLPWSPNDSAIILNNVTMPGFLMAFLWGSLLIGLIFIFDEPLRINSSDESETEKSERKEQNGPSKAGHVNSCVALVRVIFSNSAFLVSVSPPFLKYYAFACMLNARFHVFQCDRSLCIYLGSSSCQEKC